MRIGEVAERAGVTVKTVRHYESLGLIESSRLNNGYRDYDDESPRLVAEAHTLGRAGIPLERTRPFLDCLTSGSEHADDCPATRPAYRAAIDDLTSRIDELERRRAVLEQLLESAEARGDACCEFTGAVALTGRER
ncbi:MAG TPA: MerR family DNA-binding transcriptional regulator [Humibacter sp.]|jgi:DNA-binding transcriptional MerR regulator|nr:MerR family DNA-binding transcriptional regulator [Humibacter sp.]